MTSFRKKAPWILLFGDLAAFVASLWLTLFFRYLDLPDREIFFAHLAPFSLLFIVWALVFFISGLYDKQNALFSGKLSGLVVRTQIANILIATAFFYFIPWYGISPKTTLFLYLFISLCLILLWRMYIYPAVAPKSRERAVVIGTGEDMRDVIEEAKLALRSIDFLAFIDLSKPHKDILAEIRALHPTIVVADLHDDKVRALLPALYNLIFSQIRFVDVDRLCEEAFDRIPLSLIKHHWFLENVSTSPKFIYDILKRAMDVSLALILGALSLIAYPFVAIAIKAEDKGPVFIFQERIGKEDKVIRIAKFRSMSVAAQDETGAAKPQAVTRVGAFIRKTRIDELPQLWNVVKGDLSLIGPRPELPQFVRLYESEIPFYKIRHLIKPGLSGWAQIYHKTPPKFAASSEDTAVKLSYDLFYIKNRSFLLDLTIALKTIKELVSRKGL
ncbi:MAG TPA: exopolysaccharide biosynthesis polyprenyl glycosylphosphotransferase [Candidatus Paceibacterota bacterium]|nr:exopolysaccharide biosynthesis polyprenyl glycosylphosphotransferase [Candidatus Paceibacterota bacterium]